MNSLVRKLVAVGTAAAAGLIVSASVAVPAAAASAGAVVGAGTATLPAFPCPSGCTGSASLVIAGADSSGTAVAGTVGSSYTYFEPNGATCPAEGTANGAIFPAGLHPANVSANFNWTRIGLVALVSLSSVTANGAAEPNGTVVAIFAPAPTPPVGQPGGCDGTATASGVTAGVVAGGTI